MTCKELEWTRDPIMDALTAKTPFGTYNCVRTHADVSVLHFGDKELHRCITGSHRFNQQLAQSHYDVLFQALQLLGDEKVQLSVIDSNPLNNNKPQKLATHFGVGDRVFKPNGYKFRGEVRAVYTTRAGEPRAVVEVVAETDDNCEGMQHIFSFNQLEHKGPW